MSDKGITTTVYWIYRAADSGAAFLNSLKSVVEHCQFDQIVAVDTGYEADDHVRVTDLARALCPNLVTGWETTARDVEDPEAANYPLFKFAGARNKALELCTGDWVFQMDADEEVTACDWDALTAEFAAAPDSVKLFHPLLQMEADGGQECEAFASPRILRQGVTYKGDMHNYPDVGDAESVFTRNLRMKHNRRTLEDASRARRNKQRTLMADAYFLKCLEDDPNDRRSLLYLGMQRAADAQHEGAVELFRRYLATPGEPALEERYQCAVYLVRELRELGRQEEALDLCTAYVHDNRNRAELACLAGDILRHLGEAKAEADYYPAALRWYEWGHACYPPPVSSMFVEQPCHTWYPALRAYELLTFHGSGDASEEQRDTWFQRAIERGLPLNGTPLQYRRIVVFTETGQTDFVGPLVKHWGDLGCEVRLWTPPQTPEEPPMQAALEWAHLAWFEWAGMQLAEATKLPKKCHLFTRIHGFECHTDLPEQVDWTKVDTVICTADYLRLMLQRKIPDFETKTKVYTVHGGVETDRFTVDTMAKTGNKVCFAGYLNNKKNLTYLLECFYEARKLKSTLELHIAGPWQDSRCQKHCQTLIDELELADCVHFHPWQDDLNAWYADKDWFASTSMEESFCYSLAEAMAAGCTPLVHCWKTSRCLYPEASIFRTAQEFANLVARGPDPAAARNYAVKHLDVKRNIRAIMRIMAPPKVAVAGLGEAQEPWRMERKLAVALTRLGCQVSPVDSADLTIAMRKTDDVATRNGSKLCVWHAETVDKRKAALKVRSEELETLASSADIFLHSLKKSGVFLGGAEASFHPLGIERDIDVLHYGTLTPRRRKVLQVLADDGVEVTHVEEFDHAKLNVWLNRAKIVLNIHAHSATPIVETRIAECLSAGTFVMSEPLPAWSPFATMLPQWGIPNMELQKDPANFISFYLRDSALRETCRKRAFNWVWNHQRFEQNVERALERCGL